MNSILAMILCLLLFLVVLIISNFVMVVIDYYKMTYSVGDGNKLIKKLLCFSIIIFGFILIYKYLGVQNIKFFIIFASISFMLEFALRNGFKNVFYGALIKLLKLYKKGDAVEVSGFNGKIAGVNWVFTKLKDYRGNSIIIPNQKTFFPKIINYTKFYIDRSIIMVRFNEVIDINAVKSDLLECIGNSEDILTKPSPKVHIDREKGEPLLTIETWILNEYYDEVVHQNFLDIERVFLQYAPSGMEVGKVYRIVSN